jgi:hypothetical protein
MEPMVRRSISRRTSILRLSRLRIPKRYAITHAKRGWNNLRLLSAGSNTSKYDLGSEEVDGGENSSVAVFTKGADNTVRHFYTTHPRMAPEIKERGIDLLAPV